ncbi:MAG: rRNA maturation RNase YbeY [Patescibacteria group bacterium]|jgi:probable rRNA maturation factor
MIEINNTTKQKINSRKTEDIIKKFLCRYKKTGHDVSIAIVGPGRIRRLNREYRRLDKPTDVLSFSASIGFSPVQKYLGEVVINISETKKPSKYFEVFNSKKSAAYIFDFLLVHGLLHLIGYDDKTEKGRQEMLALGGQFLKWYNKS